MRVIKAKLREEQGSAGKAFLIILGVIVVLVVAGFALWKPLLKPLIGEAVPERVSEATAFNVPRDKPEVTLNIPAEWVVQRGFFAKEKALVQTPDLKMKIEIETWPGGKAPSLEALMGEVTAQNKDASEPREEVIADDILFYYVMAGAEQDRVIGALGPAGDGSISEKTSASITVNVEDGEIEEYLPTLANFLREIALQ